MNKKDYLLTFKIPVELTLLKNNPVLVKNITIINYYGKNKLEMSAEKSLEIEDIKKIIGTEFNIKKEDFEIIEKGIGLSNLFPL